MSQCEIWGIEKVLECLLMTHAEHGGRFSIAQLGSTSFMLVPIGNITLQMTHTLKYVLNKRLVVS